MSSATYEISAPALKFLPPYRIMEVTAGSSIALFKHLLMCLRIGFDSGFRGLTRPVPPSGQIGTTVAFIFIRLVFGIVSLAFLFLDPNMNIDNGRYVWVSFERIFLSASLNVSDLMLQASQSIWDPGI